MPAVISEQSIVAVTTEQVSAELGGEAVILGLKRGVYYGLDEVGARIWELVQQPTSVADVRDALLREYDVDPTRCEQDLVALLGRLEEEGLVEVREPGEGA